MSAENRDDVFVRHRGAVLDTLLSDPSFSGPSAAPGPLTGGAGIEEFAVGDPGFGSDPFASGAPAASAPRRADAGPRASERILALLNGESPAAGGMEFESDHSTLASKLASPPESPVAPDESHRSAAPLTPRSSAPNPLADLLVQVKKPKVALIIAGVLAVLLIVVLVFTTGGKDSSSTSLAVITPVSAAPAQSAPATSTAPADSTIQVKSAQSHCPPGGTPGMDAFSGDGGKAWSCARAYNVDGQVLTISLGKTYQVDSIGIVPGWDHTSPDGTDQWAKYRTVSRVSYRFDDSDATTYTQQTMDQRTLVVTKISPPVQADKVVLTVLESKGDPSVDTTAISSIVITGH
ncbi:discoidin domain-containing protein [Nocardia alni]|uniref:discoidin domain-containing protein n=1 Tax=Nocardia alni TaxID=2815723 RepID=UPI001C214FDF|nr:discoidin domain-containing protein [Nocardia alni]